MLTEQAPEPEKNCFIKQLQVHYILGTETI